MDLPTVIQLVTGIISVPASIYVFFQIRRDSQAGKRSLDDARATRTTYVHLISSLSDRSDRSLLTFNANNREKSGTFEHLVWGYWKEFETLSQNGLGVTHANNFIYNPAGVLAASQTTVAYYKADRVGVVFGTLMMLSFLTPMLITTGIGDLVGQQTFWHLAISLPIFAIFVPLGAIQSWRSFRRNRQNLRDAIKALEVIRQYVIVLESMGIIVQQEFTQLKAKSVDSDIAPPSMALEKAAA